MNPKVSVIIPFFNRSKLIDQTLKSLQNQSIDQWECIIVDDGSEPSEKAEVNTYLKLIPTR